MPNSLTSLQNESNLRPFRVCEIRRRQGTGYESAWLDVSSLVTRWPTISFNIDTIQPFSYRRGQANMSFRNDDKQFASEEFSESRFSRYSTRYKTLCRVSTGLEDTDGTRYPTTTAIFYGLFSDEIQDDTLETHITINDIGQSLAEFPASNIAGSITGVALTASQILQTVRDYTTGGNVLLAPFISSTAWVISSTGRTYTIPTTTELDGISALDLVEKLALAENHIFYIDGAGNARFSDRSETAAVQYTFRGPGEKDVNIISLDAYQEGIPKVFTKFSCELSGTSAISTQQTFTVGDRSSSDLYGQREFQFFNNFVTTAVAGSICSDLLSYFSNKRREVDITTKYITQLNIKDQVNLRYRGYPSGDGSLWGYFLWGQGLWSGYRGGITIDEAYHITGIQIDMETFVSKFHLREVS